MRRFFSLIFLLTLIFSSPLLGAEVSDLVIKNVQIQVKDKNTQLAKQKALIEGAKKAYLLLINNYFPNISLKRLPHLLDEKVINIVNKYSIANEKIISGKYEAEITYEFDLQAVNNILANLFSAPLEKKKILLIPVTYVTPNETKIWETNWWEIWNFKGNSFIQVIQPNIENISLINLKKLYSSKDKYIKKLLNIYKVEDIFIIEAKFENDSIMATLINPLLQHKSDYFYLSSSLEDNITLNKVANDIYKTFNYFPRPKFLTTSKPQEEVTFIIKGLKVWAKLRDILLRNFDYTVNYISSDIIIINTKELHKIPALLKRCPHNGVAIEEKGANYIVLTAFKYKNAD